MRVLNLKLDVLDGVIVDVKVMETYEADSYVEYFQEELAAALEDQGLKLDEALIMLLVNGYSIGEIVTVA
jgi:hypothetical protein